MASPEPSVSLAQLTASPTFDSNTISLWLQVSFSPGGYYQEGGITGVGVLALAGQLGINKNQFLFADVNSEINGNYSYKYLPITDAMQISYAGQEISQSSGMATGILNDVIVMKVTFNRL